MSKAFNKQARFIDEYIIDLNGTRAAITAGYSAKTANEQASRLLANVNIKNQINEKLSVLHAKAEITAERVLREIFNIATVDIRDLFTSDGKLNAIHDLPENCARSIASIEVEERVEEGAKSVAVIVKKIKFWDKTKSLEMLAKHLKLLNQSVEVKFQTDLAESMKRARERIQAHAINK